MSPDAVFSAGFFPVGENAFCFGRGVDANRDKPVNGQRSMIILHKNGRYTVWSSNTVSNSSAHLHLRDTGNLVLLAADGLVFVGKLCFTDGHPFASTSTHKEYKAHLFQKPHQLFLWLLLLLLPQRQHSSPSLRRPRSFEHLLARPMASKLASWKVHIQQQSNCNF